MSCLPRTAKPLVATNAFTLVLAAVLAVTPIPTPGSRLAEGNWGGQHVALAVTAEGGRLDFDCAHGTIGAPIGPDRDGRFEVRGVYTRETPGPARPEDSKGEAARYSGRVVGDEMTLSIVLEGSGEQAGTYSLRRGRLARVVKCQ